MIAKKKEEKTVNTQNRMQHNKRNRKKPNNVFSDKQFPLYYIAMNE